MYFSWTKLVLIIPLLASGGIASPIEESQYSTLQKRSDPKISTDFSKKERRQIKDAIGDAALLAEVARADPVNSVFKKYFDENDFDTATGTLGKIAGQDKDCKGPKGNKMLSSLTIRPDYPDKSGEMACTSSDILAELRDWGTDAPQLVLCPPVFNFGSINKGYAGGPSAVTCETLGPNTDYRMETLGGCLLHEYTHWYNLVVPPLSEETDDLVYGPYGCQRLDKNESLKNADSFEWFANENFWSTECDMSYGLATKESSSDPNCGNKTCKLPKGQKDSK